MLQLLATNIDICRIKGLLNKQQLASSVVTNSTIIMNTDKIPDNLVDILFENTGIIIVQDYN